MDDLIKYRLDMAEEKLKSAKILLNEGQIKDSIGRSYYAIFSAVRALLAKDHVDFSRHAGVIGYFQRNYIKTKVFDIKYSRYLTAAFQIRNNCDYNDFYVVSRESAEEQFLHASEMINTIRAYLEDTSRQIT